MRPAAAFAAGAATGAAVAGALASPAARFARMGGSSIAAPDAAGWVTDLLNAAYYRRPAGGGRDVDDLRLAMAIVTTRWHREGHRRLRAADVLPFHRAFGRARFLEATRSPRGTLDREQLLEGAARLLGPWFPAAYEDDARRAHGIVFPDTAERDAYDPGVRLRGARLGPLTPGVRPGDEQVWHTYAPVRAPSADAVVAALSQPETWPDYASAIGRFTALRRGGLAGQTFEIEVAAGTAAGRPVFTRGYVTITRLVTRADGDALGDYLADLEHGLAAFGQGEPRAVPDGADPVLAFDLTTHAGHFIGAGNNRLLLYEHDGATWLRAAGTWDRMPWHLARSYELAGRQAQAEFWGETTDPDASMLHQLVRRIGGVA